MPNQKPHIKSKNFIYCAMVTMYVLICIMLIIHFALYVKVSDDPEFNIKDAVWLSPYWTPVLVYLEFTIPILIANSINILRVKKLQEKPDRDVNLFTQLYWWNLGSSVLLLWDTIELFVKFWNMCYILVQKGHVGAAAGMMITLVIPMIMIFTWLIGTIVLMRKNPKKIPTFKMK